MAHRTCAALEDLLHAMGNAVRVGDVILLDNIHYPKAARMIEGRLLQGEALSDAVVSTLNFYSARLHTDSAGEGVQELTEAVGQWWALPVAPAATPDSQARSRAEVSAKIQRIFLAAYEGTFEGDWLDVNTNDFDLDPCGYLEEIAEAFQIQMPGYASNRELVEYVLARYKG